MGSGTQPSRGANFLEVGLPAVEIATGPHGSILRTTRAPQLPHGCAAGFGTPLLALLVFPLQEPLLELKDLQTHQLLQWVNLDSEV